MRILLILLFLTACVTPPPTIDEHYLGGPEDDITTFNDEGTPKDDGLIDWLFGSLRAADDDGILLACGWRWNWWASCKREADRRCPNGYTEIKRHPTNMPLSETRVLNGTRPPYIQNLMIIRCK